MRITFIVVIGVCVALASRPVAGQTSTSANATADKFASERGKQVYDKWCTPCHGAGEGKPGTISAAAIYKGSKPAVLAERSDLTAAGIKTAVRSGVYIMPRFRKTEVSDAELDGIIAYLTRSSR
jgi:mono/diheme cytochrome c family protein